MDNLLGNGLIEKILHLHMDWRATSRIKHDNIVEMFLGLIIKSG